MCGRYQRRSDKQKIAEAFHLGNIDGLALELTPDYNVAPQTMQPVIIWDEEFGTRTLHLMFWRFLPRHVTDPKTFKLSTINAKGETLLTNKVWRDSFLYRRCLIPSDTFLEWKREGKRRLPYVFAMKDDQPFALGGVGVVGGHRIASMTWTRSQSSQWTPTNSLLRRRDTTGCHSLSHPRTGNDGLNLVTRRDRLSISYALSTPTRRKPGERTSESTM